MLKAVFWDYQEDERGSWIKCHIPDAYLNSNIVSNLMHGEIRVDDGRRISSDQRKKIYAFCRDISNYTGHEVEDLKENILKVGFMIKENREYFSLSNVDMTTARYFIEYILEFCFEFDIPLSLNTVILAREINNYLYLCLAHRKCAICGEKADIHHHENLVGMGMDRTNHNHEDSRYIALCRVHHNECHNLGHKTFENKYKLTAIKLNERAIKELGI